MNEMIFYRQGKMTRCVAHPSVAAASHCGHIHPKDRESTLLILAGWCRRCTGMQGRAPFESTCPGCYGRRPVRRVE